MTTSGDFYSVPLYNSFGAIDDILLWVTHQFNLHIDLEARGCSVRIIGTQKGSIQVYGVSQVPFKVEFLYRDRLTNHVDKYEAVTRDEFYEKLEKLVQL